MSDIPMNFDALLAAGNDKQAFVMRGGAFQSLHFDLTAVQSKMAIDDPYRLVLGYTKTMLAFRFFVASPKRIAMIGLGGGSLAKYCHRAFPLATIEVCEIDPTVIALRDDFLVPQESPRFTVRCSNGAYYMRNCAKQVELLLVDGFDLKGLPAALCSQSFYDDCAAALAPEGIAVFNLLALDAGNPTHVYRMSRAFGNNVIVIKAEDGLNYIAFASRNAALLGTADTRLLQHAEALEQESGYGFLSYARRLIASRRSYVNAEEIFAANEINARVVKRR
ncbi:hypothetical protein [Jeongeupia chitinilytica]|uniref:Spermidine synthase n=1 Tax=Jeongeupia chitinilytica TaxID=1041641 RepID=A0ABQ3GX12_9NEIS|nr:hypothetical protein [Jeongeupia chitinilytica]GHD54980.1 hypothetical protein GCM10007350_00020 [Jeongeupia chitinilytica]